MGQCVKDKVTGFSGVVTGCTSYITGCDQFLVQPPVKDNGDFVESRWLDENRLHVMNNGDLVVVIEQEDDNGATVHGADKPAPRK